VNRLWFENGGLDQIDAELLTTLATDGRITIADLARKVGMSPPSVAERIKRLVGQAGMPSSGIGTFETCRRTGGNDRLSGRPELADLRLESRD
jgi:AraC-like DNA-binding protein